MDQLLLRVRARLEALDGAGRARWAVFSVCGALMLYLVFGRKPWEVESGAGRLAGVVAVWSWWAAAGNLIILALLGGFAKWWACPPRTIPCRLTARGGGRWFGAGVIGAALFLAFTAWPRMGQSAWHDEANRIKNTTVGNFRPQGDGSYRWRPVRWRETFFESSMPNHHLQTILSRVCNEVWRLARPGGSFPVSETALRLPSFVAGLAAVAGLAVLLRALGFPGAGVFAAWLLAVHPWMLRYAAEARGYALAMALIPAVLLCLLRAVETGRARWWAAFAVAQCALVYSYLTTVWVLVVLNAGFPLAVLALKRRGVDMPRTMAAWLAANVFAGCAFLQLTAPTIPQLAAYFASDKAKGFGWTLDGYWLQNALAHFLAGVPWSYTRESSSGRLELLPWATAHPAVFAVVVFLVCGMLFLGWRVLFRSGPIGTLAVAALVLPAPLAFAQAKVSGTMLFEWYLIFALPGLCAGFAAGVWDLVSGGTRPWARAAFPIAASGILLAYGFWTHPQRAFLRAHSIQPYREAVLLTRPALDPNHPGQEGILTAAYHAGPLFYDPRLVRVRTVGELERLMRQADEEGRELFLNLAYPATARVAAPALHAMVYEGGEFERVAALRGYFPDMDMHVFRYRRGGSERMEGGGMESGEGTR